MCKNEKRTIGWFGHVDLTNEERSKRKRKMNDIKDGEGLRKACHDRSNQIHEVGNVKSRIIEKYV